MELVYTEPRLYLCDDVYIYVVDDYGNAVRVPAHY